MYRIPQMLTHLPTAARFPRTDLIGALRAHVINYKTFPRFLSAPPRTIFLRGRTVVGPGTVNSALHNDGRAGSRSDIFRDSGTMEYIYIYIHPAYRVVAAKGYSDGSAGRRKNPRRYAAQVCGNTLARFSTLSRCLGALQRFLENRETSRRSETFRRSVPFKIAPPTHTIYPRGRLRKTSYVPRHSEKRSDEKKRRARIEGSE